MGRLVPALRNGISGRAQDIIGARPARSRAAISAPSPKASADAESRHDPPSPPRRLQTPDPAKENLALHSRRIHQPNLQTSAAARQADPAQPRAVRRLPWAAADQHGGSAGCGWETRPDRGRLHSRRGRPASAALERLGETRGTATATLAETAERQPPPHSCVARAHAGAVTATARRLRSQETVGQRTRCCAAPPVRPLRDRRPHRAQTIRLSTKPYLRTHVSHSKAST